MIRIQTLGRSVALLVVAASLTIAAPVFAQRGADDSSGSGSEKTAETTTPKTTDSPQPAPVQQQTSGKKSTHVETEPKAAGKHTEVENETETETHNETEHPELHQKGAALLAEIKAQHKEAKTPEQLKKQCEVHKDGLTNKFAATVKKSQQIQTHIDDIFTKAQAYQTANAIQVAGYDTLVANATSAQAASATSITALQAVVPTVDCNSTSVASDVATFKAGVQQTRDSLKTYRTAVKAVLHALEVPKPTADTTGSN